MPDRYVRLSGSTPASPYDTWANAASSLAQAVAVVAAGETIYVHAATYTIASSTTWTLPANVRILCTNDLANTPPTVESSAAVMDGRGVSGLNLTINGGPAYIKGIAFKSGFTSGAVIIGLALQNGNRIVAENCDFHIDPGTATSTVQFGSGTTNDHAEVWLKNCSFYFGRTDQGLTAACRMTIEGGSTLVSGSLVPVLLVKVWLKNCPSVTIIGRNLSGMTSGSIFSENTTAPCNIVLSQCKLGAATLNSSIGIAGNEYFLYDCAVGNQHYQFAHYAYNGSTTVSTAIYANDGAQYDTAGNKLAWVVAGNANASRANPYYSPWVPRYNETLSALTPSVEILRDGSTTAYKDTEVWAEFSAKIAGGSPLAAIVASDFGGHLSAGANQASGAGTGNWTGAAGSAWSGKLAPAAAITPAAIGHVQARVAVAGNFVVYADPQVRGL